MSLTGESFIDKKVAFLSALNDLNIYFFNYYLYGDTIFFNSKNFEDEVESFIEDKNNEIDLENDAKDDPDEYPDYLDRDCYISDCLTETDPEINPYDFIEIKNSNSKIKELFFSLEECFETFDKKDIIIFANEFYDLKNYFDGLIFQNPNQEWEDYSNYFSVKKFEYDIDKRKYNISFELEISEPLNLFKRLVHFIEKTNKE